MEWLRGKCIGKGAFGTVHSAVDKATGLAFAVKSVDAKNTTAAAVACLENEIRILKRLSSPCIVAYLGDDATAWSRNLHMELVPGGCASEAAARCGSVEERVARARAVLRCVTEALHYLHAVAGVVHGDVKGRNVLSGVGGGGGAKLADFGTAREITDAVDAVGPRGTPAWTAPEVARGCAPAPASDVWSLGCTAVELLTGTRPWSELGVPACAADLLLLIGFSNKRPEAPAWLSSSGKDFLDRCLRRDPDERWTCEQLLRHTFLTSEPCEAGEASPRAVLDWAVLDSDSDSEVLEHPEPDMDDLEVMTRAKGRVAELASNELDMGLEWESDSAWEADLWAQGACSELPEHDVICGCGVGGGFCGSNGCFCCVNRCREYKRSAQPLVFGAGCARLAVLSTAVLCIIILLLMQTKSVLLELTNCLCSTVCICCCRFYSEATAV